MGVRLFLVALIAAGKSRHLAAVAAERHRAPATATGSRVIVEQNPAIEVGALFEAVTGAARNQLRARPGNGSEQPLQAFLARHKTHSPHRTVPLQLVVALGNL